MIAANKYFFLAFMSGLTMFLKVRTYFPFIME